MSVESNSKIVIGGHKTLLLLTVKNQFSEFRPFVHKRSVKSMHHTKETFQLWSIKLRSRNSPMPTLSRRINDVDNLFCAHCFLSADASTIISIARFLKFRWINSISRRHLRVKIENYDNYCFLIKLWYSEQKIAFVQIRAVLATSMQLSALINSRDAIVSVGTERTAFVRFFTLFNLLQGCAFKYYGLYNP